ncbi:MAG TPA: agmatinase [Peptococcaceae bacterium]|nr:agmatinase [Peptococcaceae bacterium]
MAWKQLEAILEKQGIFMGAKSSYEEAQAVIVGLPMDFTVSYRPGARSGPQAIRNVSFAIEEYSFYQDKSLEDYRYCDLGNVGLPFGNVAASLDLIQETAEVLLEDNKFPIFLGGEHLVTYPLLKAFARKYPELRVVQFDAHADLRRDYYGEDRSHSTVMRKAVELLGPGKVYQFGIRSGIKEEFEFAKKNTRLYLEEVIEPLQSVLGELKGKPIYVSLDIDVVDPAFAPGTGTQEPGGCTSREIIRAIHLLGELDVVGFDLVEVCPQLDFSERTAILAAKIVREGLLAYLK